MKPLCFTKMEGTGNDFVIIDNREGTVREAIGTTALPDFAVKILNRHTGVGADGLILVEKSDVLPFAMHYFNQDGSEADLCLNGARCLVGYAYRLGIIEEKGKFIAPSGPVGFYYKDNSSVSLEMAAPTDIKLNFSITVARKKYRAHFLKLGVPHCVIFVDSYEKLNIEELGRTVRNHKQFKPEGTNVNFVKEEARHLFIRTYERGVEAETMSCGSGVLASAYIATKLFITQSPVVCKTKGGELLATMKDKLYLEGPVNLIFDGIFYV